MEEWKTYKLKDITTKIGSGATPSGGKEAYLGGDIALVRSQNVLDLDFSKDGLAYISDDQAQKLSNVELCLNDTLVNITGDSVARVCTVPSWVLPARVNQHVAIVRPNKSMVASKYLTYYLLTQKEHLLSLSSCGATRKALTKGMLENLDVFLPSLAYQERIVNILGSIDDKIELNNRINHNLEEQADAIIASLIEENDCKASLRDLAYYINDKTSTTLYSKADYISTENMNPYKAGICVATNLPDGRATSFSKGDTLVSNIRPYFKKIWNASRDGICSNDILCFRSSTSTPSTLYHLLRQDSFFDYVMTGAKGSKMPRGDKDQIMKWNIPSISVLCRFEKELAALDAKVIALAHENIILTEQRDLLLPMLVSGEITC